MKVLIKQLVILTIVTVSITWLLTLAKIPILIGIILSLVLQYTLYNCFIYVIDTYTAIRLRKIGVDKLKAEALKGTEVTCPCSIESTEFIPIQFNKPNYYKCKTCNKKLVALAEVETAVVTEPIANTDLGSVDKLVTDKLNEIT